MMISKMKMKAEYVAKVNFVGFRSKIYEYVKYDTEGKKATGTKTLLAIIPEKGCKDCKRPQNAEKSEKGCKLNQANILN